MSDWTDVVDACARQKARADAAEAQIRERDDRIEALEDRLRWERKHLLKPCVEALRELRAAAQEACDGDNPFLGHQLNRLQQKVNEAQDVLAAVYCVVGELGASVPDGQL